MSSGSWLNAGPACWGLESLRGILEGLEEICQGMGELLSQWLALLQWLREEMWRNRQQNRRFPLSWLPQGTPRDCKLRVMLHPGLLSSPLAKTAWRRHLSDGMKPVQACYRAT